MTLLRSDIFEFIIKMFEQTALERLPSLKLALSQIQVQDDKLIIGLIRTRGFHQLTRTHCIL